MTSINPSSHSETQTVNAQGFGTKIASVVFHIIIPVYRRTCDIP